jgi:hypothetical protein
MPEKNIFYLLRLLGSAFRSTARTDNIDLRLLGSAFRSTARTDNIDYFICIKAGERAKQYIPHYTTESDWKNNFRNNW